MVSELSEVIRQVVQDRGISEELVKRAIEDFLLAAYKQKFGTDDNAVVQFSEDGSDVSLYARRRIVEELIDSANEIALAEALEYSEEAELGDELLIEIDPQNFDRVAVQSAKQKARQTLREFQKDTLYSEYKEKEGEMVIGYYQRERNGNIFVDLGNVEGVLPKKHQSPREIYRPNDRIKALIYEVNKTPVGLSVVLSRAHTDFVRRIFELEVPEVYDRTVEIFKLVREPGYRTKLAVYSNREDVDPVGACVGMKGVRIQSIVRELEGEKIDILKYDNDPHVFIQNALSPAEIDSVVILDQAKRSALAVVQERQLSLAIGKQGLNVRLANRLVDWNIDVKTEEQFAELGMLPDSRRAVSELFSDSSDEEEISKIEELPGIPENIVTLLANSGVTLIENMLLLSEDELRNIPGLTQEDLDVLNKIVSDNVDIIEEEQGMEEELQPPQGPSDVEDEETISPEGDPVDQQEEQYECPDCGALVSPEMTSCPQCGVGISFEIEDDDEIDS